MPSCGVTRLRPTRAQATGAWTTAVVLWAFARSVVVGRVFGPHGTSGVTYFVVDVASSVPYGVTSARAVYAYLDRSPAFGRWLAGATVTYFIPDLYIVATARQLPSAIWAGFAVWLSVMTVLAVRTAITTSRPRD